MNQNTIAQVLNLGRHRVVILDRRNLVNINRREVVNFTGVCIYRLDINGKRFLIITAINFGSGTSTRHVFCNLFDITRKTIKYYSLESIYGSGACFGDFADDGHLDFVRMSYDSIDSNNDRFLLRLYSLDSVLNRFQRRDRYILFARSYTSNSMHVDIIKRAW